MTRTRSIAAGALGMTLACGARSGLEVRGTGGAAGAGGDRGRPATGGTAGSPRPGCLSRGRISQPQPVGAACAFGESVDTRTRIAVVTGYRLYGVDGAGRVSTMFTFARDWPFEPGPAGTEVVVSRGGYLAAGLSGTPAGQSKPTEATAEMVVLDGQGEVVFHEIRTVDYLSFIELRVFGSDDGVFAFALQAASQPDLVVTGPGGKRLGPFADLEPVGDPDSAGRIAVRRDGSHFWFDPCTEALTEVRANALEAYTAIDSHGQELFYVDAAEPEAFVETSDSAQGLALALQPKVDLRLSHPSGWMLVGTEVSPWVFETANVRGGTSRAIDIALPGGLRRFGSAQGSEGFDTGATHELALDSMGRLVLGLRDDSVGQMRVSSDGATWEPVGAPVGEVGRLEAVERNGTYLIRGTSLGLVPSDWTPAPPGSGRLDDQQMQLVRPEDGTAVVLFEATPGTGFTRSYLLSDDGGCVGTLRGDTLEVTSAVHGGSRAFTFPVASGYHGDFAFVAGRGVWFAAQ